MTTPQLWTAALALVVASAAGCSREEARDEVRGAAADTREAAARAADQLADSWLTTKIQAQYFADEDVKARYINVSTRDGVVTLTGFVEDEAARQQAFQIASSTDGVRQVHDRLTIGSSPPGAGFEPSDAAGPAGASGAGSAAGQESAAGQPPAGAVTPSGGVATTGGLESSPASGVPAGITDDEAITTRIQAQYFLDGTIKSRPIEVAVRNGVVTLSGEVATQEERARALTLARETEGVQRVEDNLGVSGAPGAAGAVPETAPAPAAPATPPEQ